MSIDYTGDIATKQLPRDIPYEELEQITQEMASLIVELEILEEMKRDEAKASAEGIKGIKTRLHEQSILWRDKKRERPVECRIGYDWEAGEKWFSATDTGEVFGPEPITDEDRQRRIGTWVTPGKPKGLPRQKVIAGGVIDIEAEIQ